MANWALVIGINNYPRLKSLKYAQRDAELMRDYFSKEAKFERVFYFADNSAPIQAPDGSWQDMKPTYTNILSFLYEFFEEPKLDVGDNFWFFFSGHGLRYQGQDYLVPCGGNPRLIKDTTISLSTVTQTVRRSGADNVVLLLDACRNENDLGNRSAGWQKQKGVITIASCSPEQESYEIPALEQGSFTYALLEALRIRGENNCATVERLYKRLRHRVEEINREHGKPPQTPYAVVEPASKYHLILLPQQATLQDLAQLREDALEAEVEDKLLEAKQLWIRVLAMSPTDPKVLKAYERIILKIAQQQATPSPPQSEINPPTSEEKSVNSASSAPKLSNSLPLQIDKFEVVTVNAQGQEVRREKAQAQYFTEDLGNGVTLDLVAIPPGSFLMGTEDEEIKRLNQKYNTGWFSSEQPQHKVNISSFFMGKYPITQAQWRAIASLPKVERNLKPEPSRFKGDNLPVEQVSWYDAIEFCARLSQKTGREYRLPSEAEWEYACRAINSPLDKGSPFHFGETLTSKLANYNGNYTYADEPKGEYRQKTTTVGSFPPNAFGLYDMHGNVWEWCADPWHKNYEGAPKDSRVWDEQSNNDNHYQNVVKNIEVLMKDRRNRIIRGGSWSSHPWFCRSAFRGLDIPAHGSSFFGVRVACGAARTP